MDNARKYISISNKMMPYNVDIEGNKSKQATYIHTYIYISHNVMQIQIHSPTTGMNLTKML